MTDKMMTNLEEQVKLLIELQELDTEIFKIEAELEEIPEKIKAQDEAFKEKFNNLKSLEEELKAFQLKRKEREGDLASKEDAIRKLKNQLYQVKTNKEYTVMEQEIARTKADASLMEEDIIKLLDQVDAHNQKIAKEKELLKVEEAKLNEEKAKMAEESKRLGAELNDLKSKRSALAEKVDKVIFSKYERIVNNKDGLAVVPIISDSCQGCFRVLPPQVINEVRMKHDLILCDNCSRILYIEA